MQLVLMCVCGYIFLGISMTAFMERYNQTRFEVGTFMTGLLLWPLILSLAFTRQAAHHRRRRQRGGR